MPRPLVATQVVRVIRKELALLRAHPEPDTGQLLQAADALLERAAVDDALARRRRNGGGAGLEELIRVELGETETADAGDGGGYATVVESALPASLSAAEILQVFRVERPDLGASSVTDVRRISGGFSKETIRALVVDDSQAGADVVIRKVAPGRRADGLRPEYDVVSFVAAAGVPVPQPLWFQEDCAGTPAFAATGLPGEVLGNVWGWTCQPGLSSVRDLGRAMGILHSLTPPSLPRLPLPALSTRQHQVAAVAERRDVLDGIRDRDDSFLPVFERVLDWLHANVPADAGTQVLVHGDFGLHNALFADGRLTGLLDWERAHLGNPAEDLAYVKPTLDQVGGWNEFLEAYSTAGGPSVILGDLAYFTVWQDLWRAVSSFRIRAKFLDDPAQLSDAISGLLMTPRFLARAAVAIGLQSQPSYS